MSRTSHIGPKDHVFHIPTRGNNRQDIFRDEIDYQNYFEILDRYEERYQFKLYHYVLMKNHVHLVLEPCEEGFCSLFSEELWNRRNDQANWKT